MRVIVTGREGQIARSLIERAGSEETIIPIGRPELDLTAAPESVISVIVDACPDVVVSAAAYTAVDRAEFERDVAFAVNERGAAAVAEAAGRLGVPLIQVSTDYVFDGEKPSPYVESDLTGPTGVYGASKLAGETAALRTHANSAILRTAWVYSPFGANFVKTMLRLAADRDEISIVADQVGNPSNALDIADAILQVASNLCASNDSSLRGVFHMAGAGDASWADFAEAVFDASTASGGPTAVVRRIATTDYPTPARRPANSRLDSSKLRAVHRVGLPAWQMSLPAVVERLVAAAVEPKESRQ